MRPLTLALTQIAAINQPVNIFFRDDDVDVDEPSLQRLLNIFAPRNVPITLGVIPALLTDECVVLLNEFSGTAEIVQHGWQHVNHEPIGRKCEFGVSRNFDEQYADIARGQAFLNKAFGENWFPAFIPPWNRCTATTQQALHQLGFRVLSKLQNKEHATHFHGQEISVTLDIYRWKEGATFKTPTEIIEELAQQIGQNFPIGIMLHHKVMTNGAFDFLAQLLDALQQYPQVQFHNFQSLLRRQ